MFKVFSDKELSTKSDTPWLEMGGLPKSNKDMKGGEDEEDESES